jgi:hypothetical protein
VYKAMNAMAIEYPKFAAPIPSLIELQITLSMALGMPHILYMT